MFLKQKIGRDEIRRAETAIQGQATADDDGVYGVTIYANTVARSPVELDLDGMSFENYQRNPVVLFAHDSIGVTPSGGLPIGRTIELTKNDKGEIRARFQFSNDAFAQRVKALWDAGFIRAASVAWHPLESTEKTEDKRSWWKDIKSDVLEWSIVSVPADPGALREMASRLMGERMQPDRWPVPADSPTVLPPCNDDIDVNGQPLSEYIDEQITRAVGGHARRGDNEPTPDLSEAADLARSIKATLGGSE